MNLSQELLTKLNTDYCVHDVTLTCDHVDFECHQFILARESSIFRAIFKGAKAEVMIEGFSPEEVGLGLNVIYGGMIANSETCPRLAGNISETFYLPEIFVVCFCRCLVN